MEYYILRSDSDGYAVVPATVLDKANLDVLSHDIREAIIRQLRDTPMFPAELARELGIHEQKIYYHLKQLVNLDLLEQTSSEQIRGTVAKRYKANHVNFAYLLDDDWQPLQQITHQTSTSITTLLDPFIADGELNAEIVVGSPDPHGPYKSYARDGHYATDLALFLGEYCSLPEDFTVCCDVDIKSEQRYDSNLIIVGGPGTNIITQELNEFLPVNFAIEEAEEGFACSGIQGKNQKVNGEHMGIISTTPNPYDTDKQILVLAGYQRVGSKTSVLGLTRYNDEVLEKYGGEERFGAVVDGFDMDGDGKIDSVELVE